MSHQENYLEEIQALVQTLNHNLITLATSLKGDLSSASEEALANLFQVQINLQNLLDAKRSDIAQESTAAVSPLLGEPAEDVVEREVDSIAYAQAMQYARDLVKAIRQKKEQQRRLELTSQQLIRAEKLATVGQVAAAVAHELGNILTPLQMYAKLISREAGDQAENSEIVEFSNQITQIANRASDMLRQLVDAARSERAIMIPVDLRYVIRNTLALLAPQIKNRGVNVKEYYPKDVPLVMGRPDQLEQVFINMGLNAFDAMPDGGDFTIILDTGNGISQIEQADFITIRLTDTGIGIPPEDISLLFEPFYTTKERGAGSGLGLFVSYLIIDQHGGAIEIESELGQGTTFVIKLPTANKRGQLNVGD